MMWTDAGGNQPVIKWLVLELYTEEEKSYTCNLYNPVWVDI